MGPFNDSQNINDGRLIDTQTGSISNMNTTIIDNDKRDVNIYNYG